MTLGLYHVINIPISLKFGCGGKKKKSKRHFALPPFTQEWDWGFVDIFGVFGNCSDKI